MSTEFVKELRSLEGMYRGRPRSEVLRAQHLIISEFLNHLDEAIEPVSQILIDPSSSYFVLHLSLRMIELSNDQRFVPYLIQFLDKFEDDDLCGKASQILYDFGDAAAPCVIEKLRKDFEKKIYNGFLADALGGTKKDEFVQEILVDFLNNRERYVGWFDVGHFAWRLVDIKGNRENSLELLERLLAQKNLGREDKLELRRLHKFLSDEEGYQKEEEAEDLRKAELRAKLMLTGVLNTKVEEIVPDGPRPIIDDSNLEEYTPLLYSIELLLSGFYETHPSLKDSDAIRLLKNVRDGIWKGYEGEDEFEKTFIMGLKLMAFRLAELNYTKGEISACISRILNSVKRHEEAGHGRGYLEFIKNILGGTEGRWKPGLDAWKGGHGNFP